MRQTDIISASLIIIVGLATIFFVIPAGVPVEVDGEYGLRPDFFPYLSMGMVVALATAFLLRRLFKTSEDGIEAPIRLPNWGFLTLVTALLVVAYLVFDHVGYIAGAPAVILFFMVVMGERRLVPILATTIAGPLVVWLFFWKLLSFPLP